MFWLVRFDSNLQENRCQILTLHLTSQDLLGIVNERAVLRVILGAKELFEIVFSILIVSRT